MKRIENLERLMNQPLAPVKPLRWQSEGVVTPRTKRNFLKSDFEGAVQAAQEYISAGDVFQLVLSQN